MRPVRGLLPHDDNYSRLDEHRAFSISSSPYSSYFLAHPSLDSVCFAAPFARCGLYRSRCRWNISWTPIWNLHVHSKNTHLFISKPVPCHMSIVENPAYRWMPLKAMADTLQGFTSLHESKISPSDRKSINYPITSNALMAFCTPIKTIHLRGLDSCRMLSTKISNISNHTCVSIEENCLDSFLEVSLTSLTSSIILVVCNKANKAEDLIISENQNDISDKFVNEKGKIASKFNAAYTRKHIDSRHSETYQNLRSFRLQKLQNESRIYSVYGSFPEIDSGIQLKYSKRICIPPAIPLSKSAYPDYILALEAVMKISTYAAAKMKGNASLHDTYNAVTRGLLFVGGVVGRDTSELKRAMIELGLGYSNDSMSRYATYVEEASHAEWLVAAGRHRYTLCPIKQYSDTYQLMEALLMGSIPVVIKNSMSFICDFYSKSGLPVVVVNAWSEATEAYLVKVWGKMAVRSSDVSRNAVFIDYWKKIILEELSTFMRTKGAQK